MDESCSFAPQGSSGIFLGFFWDFFGILWWVYLSVGGLGGNLPWNDQWNASEDGLERQWKSFGSRFLEGSFWDFFGIFLGIVWWVYLSVGEFDRNLLWNDQWNAPEVDLERQWKSFGSRFLEGSFWDFLGFFLRIFWSLVNVSITKWSSALSRMSKWVEPTGNISNL